MLLDKIIPSGQKVRRSFSFSPGERGWLNLAYRRLVNRCLQRSYVITDYFFSLRYCLENHRLSQVAEVAKSATVELVAHTKNCCESEFLKSDAFSELFKGVPTGNFSQLKPMRPYDVPAPVH